MLMVTYFPQPLFIRCWNDPRNGFGNMSVKIREKLQQKIKIQNISHPTDKFNIVIYINYALCFRPITS